MNMDTISVIVTEPEFQKAPEAFGATADMDIVVSTPDEPSLAAAVHQHGAFAVVVGTCRYTGALYDVLPAGGVIARFGLGCDSIDLARAHRRGLLVTNTPGVLEQAVAEHTIGLILAAAKNIGSSTRDLRAGQWQQKRSMELAGRTLAVIGCGAIGRRVGRAAKHGLGMRVVGFDHRPETGRLLQAYGFDEVTESFSCAVKDACVVTLHLSATPSDRPFVNASRLARIPASAIVVNTGRGFHLDEGGLFRALRDGKLKGAALDVFQHEPYEPVSADEDLRTQSNVIMTPHVASNTDAACRRMAERALSNIRQAWAGTTSGLDLVEGNGHA